MSCLPILVAALLTLFQAPRDQRPAATAERGTAVLGGRVTDKDTGAPLAGVTVMLSAATPPALENDRLTMNLRVVTLPGVR